MKIIEALRTKNITLLANHKQMYWSIITNTWVVFGREHGKRCNTYYYEVKSEEKAIKELLK